LFPSDENYIILIPQIGQICFDFFVGFSAKIELF